MLEILVVDDDEMVRGPIADALAGAGHHVMQAADGVAALSLMETHGYDLAVCDVSMPRLDGLTLLRRVRRESPGTDVVIMTSHTRIPDAIGSLRDGAVDYIAKPFDPQDFASRVVASIEERRSVRSRQEHVAREPGAGSLVGTSHVMRELGRRASMVAFSDRPVVVSGQDGSGKRHLARTVHAQSSRRLGPLGFLPCATLGDPSLEGRLDELDRSPWFLAALGGTLVLDGVEALAPAACASVLSALGKDAVRARTGERWEPLGIRVVALTTVDPVELEASTGLAGSLLADAGGAHLHVPSLVEREGDLYVLTAHFLRELAPAAAPQARTLSPSAWRALERYAFPGNVAELRSVLESALRGAQGGTLELRHLPERVRAAGAS